MPIPRNILLGFALCLEAIDWELEPGKNGQLVVEAILTDEVKIQEIKLSRSYDDLNGSPPTVSDALVYLEVNETLIEFEADESQPGVYLSAMPFAIIDDLEYLLMIDWQGITYTARSRLPDVAPIPTIRFVEADDPDSLTFARFDSLLYNANQQAMYELNVDWSHLSNEPNTAARLYFYTFNTIDVSEFIQPPEEKIVFPRGSIVIIKKFGLNDDFATYLRALAIETNWRGGPFYGTPASLPSNISNDGLGFFSTCAVLTDALIA